MDTPPKREILNFSSLLFLYFSFVKVKVLNSSITFPSNFREYGELLVRCGLIGEALKVFEDLELWDNLIYCYTYVNT